MRKIPILFFLAVLHAFYGCDNDTNDPKPAFNVKGFISYENDAIEQVTVSIDGKANLTTSTDANGYFEIPGVVQGDHELQIRKELNVQSETTNESVVSVSEKTVEISVNENIEIENLRLPKAVVLQEGQNITQSSADISWSPTDDNEFREYKLYRHNSSGLDETTGDLIHVSTSLNDTIFTDNELNPAEQYFYRVFIMDDFGKIGGSNIIDLTTDNLQIIGNGGFESLSTDELANWNLFPNDGGNPSNSINISMMDPFEGTNSIEFHHAEASGCWELWISQSINKASLVAGATYKVNFAYKSDFTENENMDLVLRNATLDLWLIVPIPFEASQGWEELTFEFGLPDDIGNNDVIVDFHFCIPGVRTWWLDNITIERVD